MLTEQNVEVGSPEWHRLVEEVRAMTPGERLQRALELNDAYAHSVLAELRQDYPEATDRELRFRRAVRWYGADLVKRLTGWENPIP